MVIECIGLPGSGKTYLMEKVERELKRRDVDYVNVSACCMNRLLWKIGRKLARALVFLSGDARWLRRRLQKILDGEGRLESSFGIYDSPDYTIRSAALYSFLYRRMIRSSKIYLFDEGLAHALVKFCADFKISDDTFLKLVRVSEEGTRTSRIVILNGITREDCLQSIEKRNRHICAFDELESGRLSDLLGEYERLNGAYESHFKVLEVQREEEERRKVSRILGRIRQVLEKAGNRAGAVI